MLVAYLESVRYIGHLFPMAMLRLYLGWSFLITAWERYQGDYLSQPRLVSAITEWGPGSSAPDWYKDFLDKVVVPHWQIFAYCVVYFGFLVGVSFILGFFVRPVAVLAAIVTLNFIYNSPPEAVELHKLHLVLFITMAWLGAGRCLGLDYFFFKRDRGLWW